jgi:uncharacterized protein
MMRIDSSNLEDFIRGTTILGTGGGGDPYVGKLMLMQAMQAGHSIEIMDPAELPDDARVINVLSMGAPTVINEKLPSGPATVDAVRVAERELGYKFDAVMPIEAGGINSTVPLLVGALMGLPVIDADGMGRAFPEVQMTTYNVAGVSGNPHVLADDKKSNVICNTLNNYEAEWLCRAVCVRMGGIAQMACYPMSGKQVKDHAVLNTVSLAVEIGRTIRLAREKHGDVFGDLLAFFHSRNRHARILFEGKIIDLLRETRNGFSLGRVVMAGIGASTGQLILTFQNEFLLAEHDGKPVAMVPDLITVLDQETADPITTEHLRYGQRVRVVGIGVPDLMRSPRALEVFGPKGFRLDVDYQAIETLAA